MQFSVEKVKGQGHQTSKKLPVKKFRHIWRTRSLTGGRSSANCKLGLTIVRPNLLSAPEMLGNWMNGHISCRHSASTSFPVYVKNELTFLHRFTALTLLVASQKEQDCL